MLQTPFDIFLIAAPGLEQLLAEEAREAGFADAAVQPGGVGFTGTWPDVWRANLVLRGATRVLVRIASFRTMHLAQLDKRARRVPWGDFLRPDLPVAVEATCRKSKIYHAGAAAQRIKTAIADSLGAPIADKAAITVMLRIEDDLATISLDTSGDPLYQRGHKQAVNRAPMRETMAALFLRQAGYTGIEPVLDPMCGSGTFVIEAAEWALGLLPGRDRHFAFENFADFDPAAWAAMRKPVGSPTPDLRFFGSDRDLGAVAMSRENAERAGLSSITGFAETDIADLARPDGPPGLVICNPPYGQRIGDRASGKGKGTSPELKSLYARFGAVLRERFSGWRVAFVTTDRQLAEATGLPLLPPDPPVLHGGIRIALYRTRPLP